MKRTTHARLKQCLVAHTHTYLYIDLYLFSAHRPGKHQVKRTAHPGLEECLVIALIFCECVCVFALVGLEFGEGGGFDIETYGVDIHFVIVCV